MNKFFALLARYLREEWPNWVVWTPVGFAAGILCYVAFTFEPAWWLSPLLALLCIISVYYARNHPLLVALAVVIMVMCLGASTMQWRVHRLANHQGRPLTHPLKFVTVEGVVEDIIALEHGKRVVLSAVKIGKTWPPDAPETRWRRHAPSKIRLTVRTAMEGVQIGDHIRTTAMLTPPPLPAIPGGYNFAFMAYFQEIGAVGYPIKPLLIMDRPQQDFAVLQWAKEYLANTRLAMYERIQKVLPGASGEIAAALIIGAYQAIPKVTLEELRSAGLSHILSVSGMHLTLVAIISFAAARMLLAAIPWLALRYPIKKWAAWLAIVASCVYVLISGLQIAAVRAWIMGAVVMMAVLLDRMVTPMRSIALAAMLILIVSPESIFSPSFQMSFAAVMALIAGYQSLWRYCQSWLGGRSWWLRGPSYVLGIMASSLLAGLATAPFAMYYFNQYSNYSILANVLVMPLSSLLIMPGVVLVLVAYPFGLEYAPLLLMDLGIKGMMAVAHWVAHIEYAVLLVPTMPASVLLLLSISMIWLCLWQTAWRWWGLGLLPLALLLYMIAPKPDLFIDRAGKAVAVKNEQNEWVMLHGSLRGFTKDSLLRSNAQHGSPVKSFSCANGLCHYQRHGRHVVIRLPGADPALICPQADEWIDLIEVPALSCPQEKTVTRAELEKSGAHFYYMRHDFIKKSRAPDRRRPWERW